MTKTLDEVLVIDYGGQYTHLIKRRVRDLGVAARIVDCEKVAEADLTGAKAIINSGGPQSCIGPEAVPYNPQIFKTHKPSLDICYGMQLRAHVRNGGKVVEGEKREYGKSLINILDPEDLLLDGLNGRPCVWMSHGDRIEKVPYAFKITAETEDGIIAAISSPAEKIYSVQFHPEVEHTPQGNHILSNFLYKIAECQKSWSLDDYVTEAMDYIGETVKGRDVIMFASGGVDSTVAATLLSKAKKEGRNIGNIHVVHIDNGLMRLNESEQVVDYLRTLPGLENTALEDASDYFLTKLKGLTDPEDKRKAIGNAFGDVMQMVADKLNLPTGTMLCQGTLYTDLIESGKGAGTRAAVIKSHHNANCKFIEDKKAAGLLVEPNKEFYKDQVRIIGEQLGIPYEFVWRQPFPGPGLGIRIVDQEVTREKCDMLRKAEAIYDEELKKAGLDKQIKQYFAGLLNSRTVGVMGDQRTYEQSVSLRAVKTTTFMTADPFDMPPEILGRISTRIVNEVKGVNRVFYDVTSKPPGTIEWE